MNIYTFFMYEMLLHAARVHNDACTQLLSTPWRMVYKHLLCPHLRCPHLLCPIHTLPTGLHETVCGGEVCGVGWKHVKLLQREIPT